MRRNSSTSRNPVVVISAVRAPRPSSTALVATVVPWETKPTAPPATPARLSVRRIPCRAACSKSGGVEGSLWVQILPAPSVSTTSVKVPPTSAPMRTGLSS